MTRIFRHEAIIVILKGYWKTGKTNAGLRIAEDLLDLGLIKVVGTNIKIKETDQFKYIEDFETLEKFHYDDPRNPKPKLFIFDEAGKLTTRRGAMRRMNVKFMTFIPELSKGKMKMLVITQSEYLTDSMFTTTEFTRATISTHKSKEYGYTISFSSELLNTSASVFVNSFPKTTIDYSPYQSAEFFLERRTVETHDLLCCRISRDYAIKKLSSNQISNRTGFPRRKVMDLIRRHLRHTFDRLTPEDIEEIRKEPPKMDPDALNLLEVPKAE